MKLSCFSLFSLLIINSSAAPVAWHRLERRGDTLTSYASPDGTLWTKVSSTTLPSDVELLIGLAICSHDNNRLSTVYFDNVTWQ